jgi:hypothetical protein
MLKTLSILWVGFAPLSVDIEALSEAETVGMHRIQACESPEYMGMC